MLESLRTQIQELEVDIEKLEELARVQESERATAAAKDQAQGFLEQLFEPYIEGVCQEWGVSPEEALQILIKKKATFDKIATDNPKDLEKLRNQPAIKEALKATSSLGNVSDEWINEKMTVLLEVMREIRPELANAIIETSGGREWFSDSLIGLRDILYGVPPKLNGKTPLNIES